MLILLIVACEVAFWLALLAGLLIRYRLRARRAGGIVLACVPLIDLVLLVATILDLRGGSVPSPADGLAAVYIGISVAFGPGIIGHLDARFAHRFTGAPAPPRKPKSGPGRVRYEWREFRKALLAWAISCVLLLAGIPLAGGMRRGAPLLGWVGQITVVLLVWLIWPVSYAIWPGRPRSGQGGDPAA